MRMPAPPDASTVHDAVYALAVQRYLLARRAQGERVTEAAAARIADLAATLGLQPARDVRALGFGLDGTYLRPLQVEQILTALKLVRYCGRTRQLQSLCARFIDLSVGQLESL